MSKQKVPDFQTAMRPFVKKLMYEDDKDESFQVQMNDSDMTVQTFIHTNALNIWSLLSNPYNQIIDDGLALEAISLLKFPKVYSAYAGCVKAQTEFMSLWNKFKEKNKKIIQLAKGNGFSPAFAYTVAKNKKTHKEIKSLYKMFQPQLQKFENNPYLKRSSTKFNLDITEFYIYRMTLLLYLCSLEDESVSHELFVLVTKHFKDVASYVSVCYKYATEDYPMDSLFAPYLRRFLYGNACKLDSDSVDNVMIVGYMIRSMGLVLQEDVAEIVSDYFLTKSLRPEAFLASGSGKTLYRNLEDYTTQYRKTSSSLAALLISLMNIATREYDTSVNSYLMSLSKKEFEKLLDSFLGLESMRNAIMNDPSTFNVVKVFSERIQNMYEKYKEATLSIEKSIASKKMIDRVDSKIVQEFFGYAKRQYLLREYEIGDIPLTVKMETVQKAKETISDDARKIRDLEKQIKEFEARESKEKSLAAEISTLNRKINALNRELEEKDKDRKELISLRNYVYDSENENVLNESDGDMPLEEIADYLNKNVKGVVIGGHVSFLNRIAKYLPNWKRYQPEFIIPPEVIYNADEVVMQTGHLDHSTFVSAIEHVRNSKSRLLYLHNVNIDYVIRKIYADVKSE